MTLSRVQFDPLSSAISFVRSDLSPFIQSSVLGTKSKRPNNVCIARALASRLGPMVQMTASRWRVHN